MRSMLTLAALAALCAPGRAQAVSCGSDALVTVTPPAAPPGTTVQVTVLNISSQTIWLPDSCAYQAVYAGTSCTGTPVYGPICLQVLTPIAPGASRSMPWDQKDDFGQQVPPGDYVFEVKFWDNSFTTLTSCCVPFTVLPSSVGTPYCSGDGTGTACPCANFGAPGLGCANGTFPTGCGLMGTGNPSVSQDTLVLHASTSTPGQPGLFFQGDNRIAGGAGTPFGDGLRCAGGSVVRLEVRVANAAGDAPSSVSISARGMVSPGDIKRYQWWYRDPLLSPCGTGFNLSNGLEIVWSP